jgi:cytochrome b
MLLKKAVKKKSKIMKKFFRELISDDNQINEQAFVGVVAFFAMVFILIVDVVTGILSKELIIKEFIFDGFMILTLGAFGITTAGRIMSLKKKAEEKEKSSNEEEVVD